MNIDIPSIQEFKMWYIEKYGQPAEEESWSYLHSLYLDEFLNEQI